MKIAQLLPLALATVLLASPLCADETAVAPVPAVTETAAPVAEGTATEATPVATEAARPLPKVRQGTPYMGSRGHLITYSILFFLLSVVMASVILRSKEDIPA